MESITLQKNGRRTLLEEERNETVARHYPGVNPHHQNFVVFEFCPSGISCLWIGASPKKKG
jgi:hypothetical protein